MSLVESITISNLELTRLVCAIGALLFAAHVCGHLSHKLGMPRVIGEILGGLLLGPTVLGYFDPGIQHWMFTAFEGEGKIIAMIYWAGLIMLMFVSGFEMQTTCDRKDRKLIGAAICGATVIPFLAGWAAPYFYDFSPYLGEEANMLALRIVIAIAVAVTSIPVISKIFLDLGIINTRFAKVVLATATLQDIILWMALAVATGLVSAEAMSSNRIMTIVGTTFLFFGVTFLVAPKLMKWTNGFRYNVLLKSSTSGYLLFLCLIWCVAASLLEVNVVFGAFLAGILVGLLPHEKFAQAKEHLKGVSLAFFVPIYFAIVGLKLDLVHHFDLWMFLGFLLFTTTMESIGTFLSVRLAKEDRLSSFNMAVAMNTRGGPGIVLATIAFDLGIINQSFFVTLVLVALVTSLMAGCWFRFVLSQGWPLLSEKRPALPEETCVEVKPRTSGVPEVSGIAR